MINRVLITGGASGLGRALALRYIKAGSEVAIVDLNAQAGQKTVEQIRATGGIAEFYQCDITQQAQVDLLAEHIKQRWGALDVLINNAGVAAGSLFEQDDIETWQWVFDINVLAQVRISKAFLPLLKISESGNKMLINIASQAGITAAAGMSSYCASKAAIVGFSEALHAELSRDDIHVGVVCPAFFETNLHKSMRSNQAGMEALVEKLITESGVSAEEIAEKVFQQSNDKNFMIITHAEGRKIFRLKRFLPINWYMSLVKKQSKKFFQATN